MCNMCLKNISQKIKSEIYFGLIVFILIITDQIIKWLIIKSHIKTITNYDLAFNFGLEKNFLPYLVICLIILLFYFTLKVKQSSYYGLSLMIAGGISNLIDRAFKGGVTDYIELARNVNLVFNLADVYIVVGVIIYVFERAKSKN